ncbi:MAG: S-layer homology domain-containing protein [Chloroflexi bacterium]|nr:S-layer homology domain-containing protein [Chloroflexota bacterium]
MRRLLMAVGLMIVALLLIVGTPDRKGQDSTRASSLLDSKAAHVTPLTTQRSKPNPQDLVVCEDGSPPSLSYDSPPLRSISPADPAISGTNKSPRVAAGYLSTRARLRDTIVQTTTSASMPAPILNFPGISYADLPSQGEPPDTNGAVGGNYYVQSVNKSLDFWDKSGSHIYGPILARTLWQGFPSQCDTPSNTDPIVLYDARADRWLVSYLVLLGEETTRYECVAVSASPNPLGVYHRYLFELTTDTQTIDYPKFGVWPDAYYVSAALLDTQRNPAGAEAVALQRDAMLRGAPAKFRMCPVSTPNQLLPADLEGSSLDSNLPPEGSPGLFASLGDINTNNDTLHIYQLAVDWDGQNNSRFGGTADVTTVPFTPEKCGTPAMYCVPQPNVSGTITPKLDAVSDRLMNRLVYRNLGGIERLLINYTVDLGVDTYQSGVRWYEILYPYSSPYISQQSTYAPYSSDLPWRWMGSMAMDNLGNIALGYSVSDETTFPSIRYTGREITDPLGTLKEEATLKAGSGSETDPKARWGDYSRMAVDPSDDCTFWYTNEYYATTSIQNWKTQIGTFKFPSCQPATCDVQFSDVPQGSTFYPYIYCLACRGIVSGYSDGTFHPNENVTRGQISKIVANSAFFSDFPSRHYFTDVSPGDTFYTWIERLASRDIIGGYSDGTFRPWNLATRGQISKIVYKAALITGDPGGQIYTDVLPGSTFYTYINVLTNKGIMEGYPCGTIPEEPCDPQNRPYFRPYRNATRGQMAKIDSGTFFPDCYTPGDAHTLPSNGTPIVPVPVPSRAAPIVPPAVPSVPPTVGSTPPASVTPEPPNCYPFDWIQMVSVSMSDNTITKNGGVDGKYDAGATSNMAINSGDGYVQVTADITNTNRVFGLGNSGSSASRDVLYGIYLYKSGTYAYYVCSPAMPCSSVPGSSYVVGDTFRVSVESGNVVFYHNGVAGYTTPLSFGYPFVLNASIATIGGKVYNAYICGDDIVPRP